MFNRTAGLFNRLSSQLALVNMLPAPVVARAGPLLASLKVWPPEIQSGLAGLFSPQAGEATTPFMKMIAKWVVNARRAAKEGKKVILVPFNFPSELIHAFERAEPLTSEVLSSFAASCLLGQGEEYWDMAMAMGMPDHVCSASTIELGSMLGCRDFHPQAIVSSAPGSCDVNSKMHEFVAHQLNIPHFFLQKPPDDTGRGRERYGVYLRSLIQRLEVFLGEKLREDNLRAVLEKANRCTELHYELFDLHKAVPCPVPNIFSLFLYGTRFTMWGTDEGIKTLEAMAKVSKRRLAEKAYPAEKEVARCVWAYTSYYWDFCGFFNWMEEQGYSHLGDALDLYFPSPVDTSSMDSMIDGLAESAWNMPMTRQVGAESMSRAWTEDVIFAAKSLKADCVIYCGHHSCKQTWSVVSILRSELEKRLGLPLLILQGDSWIKRMTPIGVLQQEIDEFVKNVVLNRSTPKRSLKQRRQRRLEAEAARVQP